MLPLNQLPRNGENVQESHCHITCPAPLHTLQGPQTSHHNQPFVLHTMHTGPREPSAPATPLLQQRSLSVLPSQSVRIPFRCTPGRSPSLSSAVWDWLRHAHCHLPQNQLQWRTLLRPGLHPSALVTPNWQQPLRRGGDPPHPPARDACHVSQTGPARHRDAATAAADGLHDVEGGRHPWPAKKGV